MRQENFYTIARSIVAVCFCSVLMPITSAQAQNASSQANQKTVQVFKRIALSTEFYSEGASVGDIDGDGTQDIVSGPYWYRGPDFKQRTAFYPAKAFDPKKYSNNFFSWTHDFNHDGRMDVLVVGFPGRQSFWFENPGAKVGDKTHWKQHLCVTTTDNESPTFGDLTGDGKHELIFHMGGRLGWAEPNSRDATKPWTFYPLSPKKGFRRFTHGLGFGDVNGDGRMDMLEANGWYEQPKSLNAKTADQANWTYHPAKFGPGGAQMYTYDVDGDGDQDVITSIRAHGFGLAWFEHIKQGSRITFKEHRFMDDKPAKNRYGVKFSQLHAVDLADMDGDGLKDIVVGKRYWAHGPKGDPEPNAPAVLYWFKLVRKDATKKTADNVDFLPFLIDDNSGVGTQVTATDVDGNGLPDVVVGNKKGVFVHLNHTKQVDEAAWKKAQPKVLKK